MSLQGARAGSACASGALQELLSPRRASCFPESVPARWRSCRRARTARPAPPPPKAAAPRLQSPTPTTALRVETRTETERSPRSPPQRPGGPPGPAPPGGPGPGPGPGADSSRVRHFLLLLSDYGGVYGTAAVLLAALTHIDPFGGLHWSGADVALGVALLAPALGWDALVGLPDWSTRQEDAARMAALFLDPALLAGPASQPAPSAASNGAAAPAASAGGDRGGASTAAAPAPAALPAPTTTTAATTAAVRPPAAGAASDSGAMPGAAAAVAGAGGGGEPSPLWAAGQRLRMALELMQETSVRNNAGARLTPPQELAVILVACTAEEMLYRAVLLTAFGRWIRDRLYEAGAGAEEAGSGALQLVLPGGWGPAGAGVEVDTALVAAWAALGLGVAAGAASFAAKAWQEATISRRLEAVQEAERLEAAKIARKQRLVGPHVPEAERQQQQERQARLDAAKASLVASIGRQGALVWALEGVRETYQVAACGAAFLLTGNLAAPLAGSVVAQVLVSAYQRLGLRRSIERRATLVARRRAAMQRQAAEQRLAAEQLASSSTVAAAVVGTAAAGADAEGQTAAGTEAQAGAGAQADPPGSEHRGEVVAVATRQADAGAGGPGPGREGR